MLHKPFDVYKETVKVKSMTRNRLSRTILPRNPISKFPLQNPAKIQILWLIHLVLKSHLGRGKENMFFVVGQFWDCTKRSCYTRKVKSYNFLSWRSRGLLNRLLIFPESLHTPLFLLNRFAWQPLLFFDCTEVARPMIFFATSDILFAAFATLIFALLLTLYVCYWFGCMVTHQGRWSPSSSKWESSKRCEKMH